MLIPLAGLFIACVVFGCIGTAILAIVPKLRPTLVNIAVFVLGAVPISAVGAVCYGRIFGNETGELNPNAVLGLFVVLSVTGGCAGLLSVFAYRWLMQAMPLRRDSGSRMSR